MYFCVCGGNVLFWEYLIYIVGICLCFFWVYVIGVVNIWFGYGFISFEVNIIFCKMLECCDCVCGFKNFMYGDIVL